MFIFKKQSPNGSVFLKSVSVADDIAKKIIADNIHKNRGGWYAFEVVGNVVVVGNNLWNDIESQF